jgi:hypothetical protein
MRAVGSLYVVYGNLPRKESKKCPSSTYAENLSANLIGVGSAMRGNTILEMSDRELAERRKFRTRPSDNARAD